jgi:hypothetical protein
MAFVRDGNASTRQQHPRRQLSERRDPGFDDFRRVRWLPLQMDHAKRQLGMQSSQSIGQQHVGRDLVAHQASHQIAGIVSPDLSQESDASGL